jgi:hypothetical protein
VTATKPSSENINASVDNDDDAPLVSNYKMSRAVCNGHECPYLDSISRQVCMFKTSQISTKFVDRVYFAICHHRLQFSFY